MSGDIDISCLDQVAASEIPFEFEVKDAAGQPIGLFLSILGDNAERVHKFAARKVNEDRRNAMLRLKKGKIDEYTTVEDDLEFAVEACVVRTVGWRGAKQPFSADLARTMFRRNPHIRSQVLEESANAGNFAAKPATSSQTSPSTSSV